MVGLTRFLLAISLLLLAACAAEEELPPEARYLQAQGRYEEARALAERYRQEAEAARAAMTATAAVATRQAQATHQALEIRATAQALEALATRQALELRATVTAQAAAARATEAAWSVHATATAQAMQATAVALARAQEEEARQAWWADHVWRPMQAMGMGLLILLGLALAGRAAVRVLDALVLRIRVIRDPAGFPILVPEPDRAGRLLIFLPHRSPGPALTAAPPGEGIHQVEAPAADPDTTRRAQAVELMRAAAGGRELAEAVRRMATLAPRPALEVIPADRISPEIRDWLREAEARALTDGDSR